MDEVMGELIDWAGEDGYILTMSDHGFGPKEKVVNLNLAFKEWGLLAVGGAGAVGSSTSLRKAAKKIKKVVPKSVWKRAKGAAHASIDWSKTKAFASPNPQQGIYINLQGREPNGIVPESEYESVRDEIIQKFKALRDPDDGGPVLDEIHKREDVMHGDQAASAPDLFPVCRAHSFELSEGLYSPRIITDYRELPRGFHHMDGIFGLAGPDIAAQPGRKAHLYDMAPTALYLAGLKVPEVDGKVLTEFLPEGFVSEHPVVIEKMDLPLAGAGAEASPYSADEEAAIEESLRNLGYL
jgi:predicted AlkP superfamily phosphohydrolase/phosphomutase